MRELNFYWARTDLQDDYVVRNDAEWQRVWTRHQPQGEPPPTRPAVDFSVDMVVGLTRGKLINSSSGGSFSIARVTETETALRVEYGQSESMFGTTGALPPDSPLTDFVLIPVSDKPVRFQPTEVVIVPITPLPKAALDSIESVQWPVIPRRLTNRIIRDSREWEQLWGTNMGPRAPSDTCAAPCTARRPAIDFSRHALLCVFGEFPQGYSLRLHQVRQVADILYVDTWLDIEPGVQPGGQQAHQAPVVIMVLIPQVDGFVVITNPRPSP